MCQKWLQAPNILANSPYWAFQLLVGQAMAIPSGTEFPAGNYCHCDHPRFSAPHPSLSYPEFNLSAHSSIKITLKLFLEPSPPPKLSHPAGRKRQTRSLHVSLLFLPLLMKSSLQGSEDAAGGWHEKYSVHRYLHLHAIIFYEANDSSCLTCRLGMQSEVFGKCYLKQSTRVSLRWEKKSEGKIKQEGREKEFQSMGKISSIKTGASPPSGLARCL